MKENENDKKWTIKNIPDLTGKVSIVTGANSGLGFEITKTLAMKKSHVIMACRNLKKAEIARDKIINEIPYAILEPMELDLASIESIRKFANKFTDFHENLDILINNAGVMHIPYMETEDGFEMQFGVNHLGHFALTGLLMNVIMKTKGARVVTVSSLLHKNGKIQFYDINMKKSYNKNKAYAQSKIANLYFAYELQERFEMHGIDAMSLAAHPGYADTNLQLVGPKIEKNEIKLRTMKLFNKTAAQSPLMGALPILYAATDPNVKGGKFYGPDGRFEIKGYPKEVESDIRSHDRYISIKLWDVSKELTGVYYSSMNIKVDCMQVLDAC